MLLQSWEPKLLYLLLLKKGKRVDLVSNPHYKLKCCCSAFLSSLSNLEKWDAGIEMQIILACQAGANLFLSHQETFRQVHFQHDAQTQLFSSRRLLWQQCQPSLWFCCMLQQSSSGNSWAGLCQSRYHQWHCKQLHCLQWLGDRWVALLPVSAPPPMAPLTQSPPSWFLVADLHSHHLPLEYQDRLLKQWPWLENQKKKGGAHLGEEKQRTFQYKSVRLTFTY